MRRFIVFVLILTIPIGFLLGAHKAVDALQDDVTLTCVAFTGDKDRVAGKQVRMTSSAGEHMRWETVLTDGESVQTEFTFSQKTLRENDSSQWQWEDFNLYLCAGMGMSTYGGDGMTFPDEGMGKLLNVVAERTEPGESRTEEILLEDYLEYYPLDYEVSIFRNGYAINDGYSTIGNGFLSTQDEGDDHAAYDKWCELFRFPVMPGDAVEITLTRDYDGGIRDISINSSGAETTPYVNFVYFAADEGLYFCPSFSYGDGTIITTGQYPEGYGLYYIPYLPLEGQAVRYGETYLEATFDFDALELVYGMETTDQMAAMETSADGKRLHLLTQEGGNYYYSALDLATGEVTQKVEIMASGGASYDFFPEQELLFLRDGQQAALVYIGENAKVEFVADWPRDSMMDMPSSIDYEDGVLYLTSLAWYEGEYCLCLAVLDENGLGYNSCYSCNLQHNNLYSGHQYISMDSVKFVE